MVRHHRFAVRLVWIDAVVRRFLGRKRFKTAPSPRFSDASDVGFWRDAGDSCAAYQSISSTRTSCANAFAAGFVVWRFALARRVVSAVFADVHRTGARCFATTAYFGSRPQR